MSVNPPAQSNFQNRFPGRAKCRPSSPESVPGLIPQNRTRRSGPTRSARACSMEKKRIRPRDAERLPGTASDQIRQLRGFEREAADAPARRHRTSGTPEDLVAADSLMTGVIRQRYLPIEKVVQLPPPDVIHLMFVIVRTVTKRAIVVLEPYGSFGTGMVHGVGTVVVVLADRRVSFCRSAVSAFPVPT